jgi:hypothetical protein
MTKSRIDLRPGVTEPVVLMFSRREVEAGDPMPAIGRLKALLSSREAIWKYRGQMSLVVAGYDDDPRELVDVAKVRSFLRAFDRVWPYWAYYFNQVDDSIKLYLACLCGASYPGRGAVEIDPELLGSLMRRGFAAMNSLFEEYGFPEAELEVISRGIGEVIEQAGMGA